MVTRELVEVKQYLQEELKNHYYVVWEKVEICSDDNDTISTEEVVKVMFEPSDNSSLVPMFVVTVLNPSDIEDTLEVVKKECKTIFKEKVPA